MLTAVFAFVGSLLAAVALTPLARQLAVALGAVDQPGERRVHAHAVPRLGGLATVSADDRLMRASIASGVRGIVVAATGAGNTDPSLLAAAEDAMARGIPVVLATRALSVAIPVFAYIWRYSFEISTNASRARSDATHDERRQIAGKA